MSPLPPEDAVLLLREWGGRHVIDASAAGRICELVGRLPLAIRLAGRLLAEQSLHTTELLAWLEASPLQALNLVTTWEVMKPLGELVNYGLLVRKDGGYEVTHALIHTYARLNLAPSCEVIAQLANHFIAFVTDHQDDLRQLTGVRPHVRAILDCCVTQEAWQTVTDIAWAVHGFLEIQGFYLDRIATIEAGLKAGRATNDRRGEGNRLGNLGNAYSDLGQVERARQHLTETLRIFEEIKSPNAEIVLQWLAELDK